MYSYKTELTDDKDIKKNNNSDIKESKKAKGVKKNVIENNIRFDNYKRALFSNNIIGEHLKIENIKDEDF